MANWKLHLPTEDNLFSEYKCGLIAGRSVALRKDLIVLDHRGKPTGEIRPKGEVWKVLRGLHSDPVVWFRQPNGERFTWADVSAEVAGWFELVDDNTARCV